jgi:hypothetical protein
MTQQLILRPQGLVTQPSYIGLEPGAMFTAIGLYIRSPGLIENAFAWKDSASVVSAGGNVFIVAPLGTQTLIINPDQTPLSSATNWWYQWNLQTTGALQGSSQQLRDENSRGCVIDETARFSRITMRGRTLINGRYGVLAWDSVSPTSTAERTARRAGMLPPTLTYSRPSSAGAGIAVPANNALHATAVLRRKFSDGYEIVSAPSPAQYCTYDTVAYNIEHNVSLRASGYRRVGDVVEIYRTRCQLATPDASKINTGPDYYLACTRTLTSADVTAGSVTIIDTVPDTNLGEALYTNSGVKGADSLSLPPPTCKCMAVFKGYAFFGNRTDPPVYSFRIPAIWDDMGTGATGAAGPSRKAGVGYRTVSGTATIGSNVITAVSAADIVGIVVGQAVSSSIRFTGGTVTAVSATTITLSNNATSSGAETTILGDMISINGSLIYAGTANEFSSNVQTSGVEETYTSMLDRVYGVTVPAAARPMTVPADNTFISVLFEYGSNGLTLSLKATNGANYVPALPSMTSTAQDFTHTPVPNGISWSELNQPENCPPLNTAYVGSGEIYAMAATRDALWIFASDGLWRLSGTGGVAGSGYDWRIDPVDSTLIISGPQAFCVLRDTVYAYTNRGLVAIDSSGNVGEISNGRIGDFLPGPMWITPVWNNATSMYMVADETNDEVLLKEPLISAYFYRYNILTDTLVQDTASSGFTNSGHGAYSRTLELPLIGLGTNVVRTVDTTARVGFNIVYRPVFVTSNFTLKHWRVVDLSTSSTGGSSVIDCYCNGVFIGRGTSAARLGFTIARNCPAVGNLITLRLVSDPLSATPGVRTVLQASALKYDEFTEQRKVR